MKICLIANVGKRDLQLDGAPLPAKGEGGLRGQAAALLKDYDTVRERLSAPMIQPALERIFRLKTERIAALLLVATDQEDEAFRGGDTVECAEVLKRFVFDQCSRGKAPEKKQLTQEPIVVRISEAPHQYDRMADFYRKKIVTEKALRDADCVYLLCAGGTPACNTALLLAGVARFREKCEVLNVDEGTGTVGLLSIGREMLDGYRREARGRLLERWDFDAIACDPACGLSLRRVAEAAEARLNFDFERHERRLADLAPTEARHRRDLDALDVEAQYLTKLCDEAKLLQELYWNAHVKWQRNECADFLGRVWRLCEAALYRVVGQITGLKFDGTRKSEVCFERWASAQSGLMEWVQKEMRQPQVALRPNTEILQHTLTYMIQPENLSRFPAAPPELGEIARQVEVLYRARGLRNKSIIAHGYQGLSKEGILGELETEEEGLFNTLRRLLEAQGVAINDNPFDRYAKLIRALDKDGA